MSRMLIKALRVLVLVILTSFAGRAFAQPPPLGCQMPKLLRNFASPSCSSATLSSRLGDSATVLVFLSNQCAWTDRYADRLNSVINDFSGRGVSFILVNANDPEAFPADSPEQDRKSTRLNSSHVAIS